jgi:hypothetical protein
LIAEEGTMFRLGFHKDIHHWMQQKTLSTSDHCSAPDQSVSRSPGTDT